MELLESFKNLNSTELLVRFVQKEYQNSYNFFISQKYSEILNHKDEVENILSNKFYLIKDLDYSVETNRAFLSVILLACERLGLFSLFERYYRLFKRKEDISLRLQAIAKYRIGCKRFSDYESRFDDILSLLQSAFENEEDKIEIVLSTFIGFYARVVLNFGKQNQGKVISFKERIISYKATNYLLQHNLIEDVLLVDTTHLEESYKKIQQLLDDYLNRSIYLPIHLEDSTTLLIEDEKTDYSVKLSTSNKTFESIQNISIEEYKLIKDDNIYTSLGRGTVILEDEKQLYAYLYSFGSAHYQKMKSALELFDFSELKGPIEIIDWGCGQGLASVVFFEETKKLDIVKVTLVEPSEKAIKRASRHVKHMLKDVEIATICKPIDLLTEDDIITNNENIKIHLFSNILDVESFSIENLISKIEKSQKKTNYFICVSPFSTDIRNQRISNFVEYFERAYSERFKLLGNSTSSKTTDFWNCNNSFKNNKCYNHVGNGCSKRWTKTIKVFKCML